MTPNYCLRTYLGDDEGVWRSDGNIWWAYCDEMDCYGDGETEEAAVKNCRAGIADKAAVIIEGGSSLPEPRGASIPEEFSGKFVVRMPKSLHRKLTQEAELEKVSMNTLIVSRLAERANPLEVQFRQMMQMVVQSTYETFRVIKAYSYGNQFSGPLLSNQLHPWIHSLAGPLNPSSITMNAETITFPQRVSARPLGATYVGAFNA